MLINLSFFSDRIRNRDSETIENCGACALKREEEAALVAALAKAEEEDARLP